RGVDRQPIFFARENWGFFIQRMHQYFQPQYVDVIAYCLMPNHYHILVYIKVDDEFGTRVMQPFGTSYVKAVNRYKKRIGPLFQGRYKAKLVDSGQYLHTLTRYIHLNPVCARLVDDPADWPYSSYLDYVGLRNGQLPKPDIILEQFETRDSYRKFVLDQQDEIQSLKNIRPFLFD
ncbi:MAG: transposase, partial [Anaerolineales bacterium]|nr:transposase [Anaerolineales bacterium]